MHGSFGSSIKALKADEASKLTLAGLQFLRLGARLILECRETELFFYLIQNSIWSGKSMIGYNCPPSSSRLAFQS